MDPNVFSKIKAISKAHSEADASDNITVYIGFLLIILGGLISVLVLSFYYQSFLYHSHTCKCLIFSLSFPIW